MIILRQKIYSRQDTINNYVNGFINSGNGGIIIPRKWSRNGKERSKNKSTIIIPRLPEDDKKKSILERVRKIFNKEIEK